MPLVLPIYSRHQNAGLGTFLFPWTPLKQLECIVTNCFWSRSANFEETWAFLDRRLGDLQAAPSLAQVLSLSPSPFFLLIGFGKIETHLL